MLQISIPGKPLAKHRPRFFRKGNFIGTYNDQKTDEGKFMLMAASQIPKEWTKPDCPVRVTLGFYMPIPKNFPKYKVKEIESGVPVWHDKKPDIDNLEKFALDCIRDLAIGDDATVSYIHSVKMYAKNPHTEITIQRLDIVV